MSDFVVQQRCFNSAEPEMGLGTIIHCDHRTVGVFFPATEQTRTYARQSAPLIRAVFNIGDTIRSNSGQPLTVKKIEQQNDFLVYHGCYTNSSQEVSLHEKDLDSHQQLTYPTDRLFSGQVDSSKQFQLRYLAHQIQYNLAKDPTRGLKGGRTLLLPHQLYIANEVANRHSPRVLLADEVGLGKTIEAGLIIHQQLLTGRAQRILILVPESLLHQWLVEMLRRFNLQFSLLDAERCADSNTEENPFEQAQLILASLDFVSSSPEIAAQALQCEWDLLVVDEAHHLSWSEQQQSIEYQLIDTFSQSTKGLILLTATPEQAGQSSYFACLRLLDPERFHSLSAFIQEEQQFSHLAQITERLLSDQEIEGELLKILESIVAESGDKALLEQVQANDQQAVQKVIDHLIDRHGTGRVLFRNTRKTISGFPERILNPIALDCPPIYQNLDGKNLTDLLYPERCFQRQLKTAQAWIKQDPRVNWLIQFLESQGQEKCLLITAQTETAQELAEWLKKHSRIKTGLFNEKMSLLERDRAAAYFAELDEGAQLLICSEIGSEGRNFQFAHHLVLFDLPVNPDLLEQRIGRLDRIGQTHAIQIHVPFLANTPQQRLFNWYHDGLNAFTQHCRGAAEVYKQTREQLENFLIEQNVDSKKFAVFIKDCQEISENINLQREQGRDRLLEYHSNHPVQAQALIKQINKSENETELLTFLENVVDNHALEMEVYRRDSYLLKPDLQADYPDFPLIKDEGLVFTCDRNTALANENFQFFTWEHPIVTDALDRITSQELGNNCVVVLEDNSFRTGTLLLECLFLLSPPANVMQQGNRYLPPQLIRIVLDAKGEDISQQLPHTEINQSALMLPSDTAEQLIEHFTTEIRRNLSHAKNLAATMQQQPLISAHKEASSALDDEITRLTALAVVNKNVRQEEIDALILEKNNLNLLFDQAQLQLDALRVIITS